MRYLQSRLCASCHVMSDLDQQGSRKLLIKGICLSKNSFNLDENARPFEFFEFIPFKSNAQQKSLKDCPKPKADC